ncbi:hypothetical protein ABEG18_09910 [Alsobacter sp. KACC 23698]|uniref:Uncharacterized protein n=1 Tax=Alsobacter sp. KACC 23698 TaxID=3149229 RepID=A0AAU7JLG9_9HYPH
MDVTTEELDGPARLRYCRAGDGLTDGTEWEKARRFASLREALHVVATEDPPAGAEPYVMTNVGRTLKPEQLAVTWDAIQGP